MYRHATLVVALSIVSCSAAGAKGQDVAAMLPDAPSVVLEVARAVPPSSVEWDAPATDFSAVFVADSSSSAGQSGVDAEQQSTNVQQRPSSACATDPKGSVDANCAAIPLELLQPQRILGFMPNFRTVSAGSKPPPPSWNYNLHVATEQAFDYSSFIFLGLTSLSAEWLDEHPALGKGPAGFYAYTWRGLLDKTDGTYLSAWLLPSLLHEDTRFYPLGHGHKIAARALYVISRQAVAQTYGGRQTPNIAGLGGKVLTQYISRYYYPAGSSDFGVLAEKFGYSVMRDVIFSTIREFYPDIAAYAIKKHQEKIARQAAADAR